VSFDLAKYLSLFVAEAAEHLAAYSKRVVELEKAVRAGSGETRPIVDGLFRHAHSLKGMAASMQLEGISALAHKAEDLVDALRRGTAGVDAGAVDVLLAAGDALHDMVAAASRGERPEAPRVLLARLDESARGRKDAHPDPPAAPATAPAPPLPAPEAPALGRGARRVQVEVEIAGSCPVPAVRGFLVVKKLSALGGLVRATPSVEDLKAGRIPGKRLEVAIDTAETLQAVERALAQISDIASVSLREAGGEPPPEKAPVGTAPAAGTVDAPRTVRVRTEILDYFLDAVGELLLATARLREVGKTLPASHRPHLDEGVDRLHGIVKDLHDKVMTVRMTPIAVVTERLPRAARDVARKVGKQVDVEIKGAEIEIDRAILEELGDPLVHILRNAVDHGIEAPQARLLAGKPAVGRVSVRARRDRDRVILEIADDGRGMDPARLRAAAVARGVLRPEAAAALADREALQLACLPGISTAEAVTDVSGRGVGLDVVKKTVETLGGTLEIDSVRGAGTRFTFRLPLTVAVQQVLLVRVGEEVLGLPITKVHGAAQVELSRLDRSRGAPVLPMGGELVPVHDLSRLLGFPELAARGERAVVVAEGSDGWIGLAVDALLGQQEAVLKPLGPPLEGLPGLSAVTVLGNGRPVFILDVPRLLAA
jgi:two-component system chemotaxis sensor kinase CheA